MFKKLIDFISKKKTTYKTLEREVEIEGETYIQSHGIPPVYTKKEEKTKYRLKAEKTTCGDLSLQFLHNEKWYYVPEDNTCYVLGHNLTKNLCYEDGYSPDGRFMTSFIDQEKYDLIPFTKKYPIIEEYFLDMQAKRVVYLANEKRKENLKDIYL